MIECSKINLEQQQRLLKSILDFKKTRDAFINDPTSSKLATSLVKNAMRVRVDMENCQAMHLFSNDFLSEIQFFAQVGMQHHLSKEAS